MITRFLWNWNIWIHLEKSTAQSQTLTFEIFGQIWTPQVKFHENVIYILIWSRETTNLEITYKKGKVENVGNFTKYKKFMFKCTTLQACNFFIKPPFFMLQWSNWRYCFILQLFHMVWYPRNALIRRYELIKSWLH